MKKINFFNFLPQIFSNLGIKSSLKFRLPNNEIIYIDFTISSEIIFIHENLNFLIFEKLKELGLNEVILRRQRIFFLR